jgi:enterochelin esterase-like enzyme
MRFSYALSPNDRLVSLIDPSRDRVRDLSAFERDPLNPRHLAEHFSSYVELPAAPAEFIVPVVQGKRGNLVQATITTGVSRHDREVWVYTPAGFNPGRDRYPLLLLFDGIRYTSSTSPANVILDNLIADKRIPPLVAILVSNTNRTVDLSCSADFADFIARELVPWAREKYHATADPDKTVVAGSSIGGLAASFAGLTHPEVFGNVLSLSGSYWWNPKDDSKPEWLTRQFAQAPKLPLRFFVSVGSMELKDRQVDTNRRFRDLLTAKGYRLSYREFNGGHGYLSWRESLAEGLSYLFGDRKL